MTQVTGVARVSHGTDERRIAERLAAAGVASPHWDAGMLVRHASTTGADLETLVRRRAAREPLQHILGTAAFRYLELAVGLGVFVPRPETELLVDAALAAVRGLARPVAVDLCAGSGAVGISLGVELARMGIDADVHLVESDPRAMPWLSRNVSTYGSEARRLRVHEGDLANAVAALVGCVDVVAANPPYLPESAPIDRETRFDPEAALWGGADGLDVIRRVVPVAAGLLHEGGTLVVEHDVSHDLRPLFGPEWHSVARHDDLTGRPRFSTAVRS